METRKTLEGFARFLEKKNMSYEIIVAGGAALHLLNITNRLTSDVDIVSPSKIPQDLLLAAMEFAEQSDNTLDIAWLNSAASIYTSRLEPNWETRASTSIDLPGLRVKVLARPDLLKMKLGAMCDRGRDLQDCVALKPSKSELLEAEAWLLSVSKDPTWPKKVKLGFERLEAKLQTDREPAFD